MEEVVSFDWLGLDVNIVAFIKGVDWCLNILLISNEQLLSPNSIVVAVYVVKDIVLTSEAGHLVLFISHFDFTNSIIFD